MKTTRRGSWHNLVSATLALTALLAFAARSSVAQTQEPQTPTPEVQQLKDRLQLLEQTVKDLKAQIGAMETKKSAEPAIINADYSTAPVPAPESAVNVPPTPAKPQDAKGESTFTVYGFAMLDAG